MKIWDRILIKSCLTFFPVKEYTQHNHITLCAGIVDFSADDIKKCYKIVTFDRIATNQVHIWNQLGKWIKMSTNMPMSDPMVLEIRSWLLHLLSIEMLPCINYT